MFEADLKHVKNKIFEMMVYTWRYWGSGSEIG
jgi:hypothetical protein